MWRTWSRSKDDAWQGLRWLRGMELLGRREVSVEAVGWRGVVELGVLTMELVIWDGGVMIFWLG